MLNKSGRRMCRRFRISNIELEGVNKYRYLRIVITSNGSFTDAIKQLCSKATKSLERLKRIFFSTKNDIKLYIDLFEKFVAQICTAVKYVVHTSSHLQKV